MAVLKFLKHNLAEAIKERKWRSQLRHVQGNAITSSAKPFATDRRILVIAPHADDELIGCHQLIKNYRDIVTVFYCSLLGSNYSQKNRQVRQAEFERYLASQGCNYIISSPDLLKQDLLKAINDVNPGYIFLPSYIDWQKEHRQVNEVLVDLYSELRDCMIGFYHVSLPIPLVYVSSFSGLTRQNFKYKWAAMRKFYQSQLHMDIKRFEFIERASSTATYALETYIVMSGEKWLGFVQSLKAKLPEIDSLKETLGNIKEMHEQTAKIYSTIM